MKIPVSVEYGIFAVTCVLCVGYLSKTDINLLFIFYYATISYKN